LNYGDGTDANVQHPTPNVQRPIAEKEHTRTSGRMFIIGVVD